MLLKYDKKAHQLAQLEIGSNVVTYYPGKNSYKHWHKRVRIGEVLPQEQYQVNLNGSVRTTIWNRKLMVQIHSMVQNQSLDIPVTLLPTSKSQIPAPSITKRTTT